MPQLIILRHANAIRYNYDDDFNRRLRDKGKRNAQRVGGWLASHQPLPEKVYTSPAVRAFRTAKIACKAGGLDSRYIEIHEDLYPGSDKVFSELLANIPAALQRVMLVGHNPALDEFLIRLSSEVLPVNKNGNVLSPASFAILEWDGEWGKVLNSKSTVSKLVHADSLPG